MQVRQQASQLIYLPSKPKFKSYQLNNFREIPQMDKLGEQQKFDIEVVGNVLPFKVNNYVIEQLIDWEQVPNDPMFVLTFPQKDMLRPEHYDEIAALLKQGADKAVIREAANRIRMQLNPHPAGQADHNVPEFEGEKLHGVQHKYQQTVLFFPSQGQTLLHLLLPLAAVHRPERRQVRQPRNREAGGLRAAARRDHRHPVHRRRPDDHVGEEPGRLHRAVAAGRPAQPDQHTHRHQGAGLLAA